MGKSRLSDRTEVGRGGQTTKIRTLAGNLVLLPTAKLTELIVTNYSQPEMGMAVLVGLASATAAIWSVERATYSLTASMRRPRSCEAPKGSG
jgi:small-conductance mechanosensitive channel